MSKKPTTSPNGTVHSVEPLVEREVIETKVSVLNAEIETKPAYSDPVRAREFRAIQATTQQPGWRNPREQRFSNLPTPGKFSAQMDAAADAERVAAETRAAAAKQFANRKWFKFGLQPTEKGYTLHVEHFEGDKKIKETLHTGLTVLGAREKAAMQMAAFWASFG